MTSWDSPTPTSEKQQILIEVNSPTQEELASKRLRVAPSSAACARLKRSLFVLHGTPPHDEPLEHDITYSVQNRRNLGPLTISYRSEEGDRAIVDGWWQDRVANAIWARLRALLPQSSAEELQELPRPSVVFEEDADTSMEVRYCIDLVFEPRSIEAFKAARDGLEVIQVDEEPLPPIIYRQLTWTNTLSGQIFPIDILKIPISQACLTQFYTSLQDLTAPIGSLLGAGLIQVEGWRTSSNFPSSNIIRAYVKLSPASMEVDLMTMVCRLPTHMMWQGVVYTLQYAGRELHGGQKVSVKYPGERLAGEGSGWE